MTDAHQPSQNLRRTLAAVIALVVGRILDHGHPIEGAQDHGATVSVYLRDPDGNGIELYYDRPREEWFDLEGRPIVKAEAFDPRELLTEPGSRSRVEASQSSREDQ